jgi:hypothetical protein
VGEEREPADGVAPGATAVGARDGG